MNRVNLICKDITGFITGLFFGLICKDITGLEQLDKAAMLVDKTVQIPVNIFIPEFARKNLFSSQWRGTLLFLSTNSGCRKVSHAI